MIAYFNHLLTSIQQSINTLDEAQFEKLLSDCYEAVANGNKIIVSGLGKNVPICEKFVGTLNSFGINAAFLHTNTAIHGDLGIIKDGDTTLLLSKSGGTVETLLLLEHVKKRNTRLWGISFQDGGALAKQCENCLLLQLDHEGDKWNIVPNNSTTLYLIILQGLAMQLADRLGITLSEFKTNHPGGKIGEILSET